MPLLLSDVVLRTTLPVEGNSPHPAEVLAPADAPAVAPADAPVDVPDDDVVDGSTPVITGPP
jgi:hypothetical protein